MLGACLVIAYAVDKRRERKREKQRALEPESKPLVGETEAMPRDRDV